MVKKAWDLVDEAKNRIENLTPQQVAEEIANGTATLVDIRDIRELNREGKIPGAVHAPRGMLEFWVDPSSEYYRDVFDPSQRYIFYCAAGGRSALATDTVRAMGYDNVAHLETGFTGWRDAGLDVQEVPRK